MTTKATPPPVSELPETLPLFPLTGTLLLPGNWLPLNIFEPRYRNMVQDALEGEGYIGMIQPLVPRQDNRPLPGAEKDVPELYGVGCAGRIEECQETPDGRFLVALMGVHRFRIREEMPLFERGYRRVAVDYGDFDDEPSDAPAQPPSEELLEAVQVFAQAQQLELDMERLSVLPEPLLVNGLAVALPFAPAEKQALLEAGAADRRGILLTLLRMAEDATQAASSEEPPVTN